MTWKYLDETKSANKKFREEMMQRINSWWAHFQNKRKTIEAYLEGRGHFEVEDFMADTLQQIDENLMWEFGIEPSGKFHLVITPETERHLRPLVETVLATAPKLEHWAFYAYRQPHGVADTAELVRDNSGVALDDFVFAATPDDDHLINLQFHYKGSKGKEARTDAVFTATEYLLGEEVLDRWIGDMDFVEDADAKFRPMSELPNTVAGMIEQIKSKLPGKPLSSDRGALKAQTFTGEPDEDDQADRMDIVSATTLIPHIWQAAHNGGAFDSCRFSKHNERFCYLKVDDVTEAAKVAALEKEINEALNKAGAGCTTGSAIATEGCYIDLCVTDPMKAVTALKGVINSHCSLRFFDAELAAESITLN
jgi:hypothetical protein